MNKVILAQQIPETELTLMSTDQLIQKYLNSRFPLYIFLYPDDINLSFEKASNDYNGLRELLKREDAAKCLLRIYQRMTPNAYENNWEPVKKGQFAFTFVFVEILISQESILNSFTESEAKTVLAELLKKNELKAHHPELYSMFDIQFNSYSMAKLLYSKGKGNGISQALLQTPAMDEFLKSGRLKNKEVLSVLFQKAKEFLNAN